MSEVISQEDLSREIAEDRKKWTRTLTPNEIAELTLDSMIDRPSRLTFPAAVAMRKVIDKEYAACRAEGRVMYIPSDTSDPVPAADTELAEEID